MLRDTWEGYESRHDSRRHPESEGAAEDAQEDAEGLEQRHGLEAVAVVSSRLVGHDGAARWTQARQVKGGSGRGQKAVSHQRVSTSSNK